MQRKRWIKTIMAFTCMVNGAGADIIWPSDGDWNALMHGTNYYHDTTGDTTQSSLDLVGSLDTFAAGYWALVEDGYDDGGSTSDAFMFRMRLSGDGSGGPGKPYVWQVSMDTDGDASNVEWLLQLDQKSKPADRSVQLIQTTTGGLTLEDVDTTGNTAAWIGDYGLFSRWTSIADSSDYYVDIAVPWTTFTSITGATEVEQVRAVLSTSINLQNISGGDAPLGSALTDQISDVLTDNIPEPTVASLLLGSGFGFLVFRRIFTRRPTDSDSSQ